MEIFIFGLFCLTVFRFWTIILLGMSAEVFFILGLFLPYCAWFRTKILLGMSNYCHQQECSVEIFLSLGYFCLCPVPDHNSAWNV